MTFKYVLGVDMSKNWFNYSLMDTNYDILGEGKIENSDDSIFVFLSELLKCEEIENINNVFLCLEHTGIYVKPLVKCWTSKGGELSLIHAPKISQSLAGSQGWEEKTDPLDARRIAEYGIRFHDKLQVWQIKNQSLDLLQVLQRQRERLLQAINTLKVPVKESKQFDSADIYETLCDNQSHSIKALKGDLKKVEKSIEQTIVEDPYLSKLFKLITSVEGVGPVTGREIMIATGGFTDFMPTQAKAFARYTGVVPYKKQSGKSVRKKDRIGKRSHKKVKALLTMGALALLKHKGELCDYYHRKLNEGKHHSSIINAMRNKMILRIFAVVRNQVMYQKNLNNSLVLP